MKIKDIIKKIKFTDFIIPRNKNIKISQGYVNVSLTAKNNKKYSSTIGLAITIKPEEELKGEKYLLSLIESKYEKAKYSIKNFVEKILTERVGLKGYRGYFSFKDVEAY